MALNLFAYSERIQNGRIPLQWCFKAYEMHGSQIKALNGPCFQPVRLVYTFSERGT